MPAPVEVKEGDAFVDRILTSILLCISLVLGACASSKISEAPVGGAPTHKVQVIAMAPGGGLVADAVAVELANRGYGHRLGDDKQPNGGLNLSEIEVARPDGLAKLKEQGIDAFLSVRAAAAGDGRPESASARLNSTVMGRLLAGITWQNGWGCAQGSPCDRVMRKGLSEAAREIADALAKRVQQAP